MNKDFKIETNRLCLARMNASHIADVFAYRSDAEINRYQSFIPATEKALSRRFGVNNPVKINTENTWIQLAIIDKLSNKVIGDLGVHFMDKDSGQIELGITLSKEKHNQGFASEAMNAMIDAMFLMYDKRRIICSVDPRNTASIRLIERLKFRKEAHFRESFFFNGEWADDVVYAMLRSDWDALHKENK